MSITLDDLAAELGTDTDTDTIAMHARQLLRSGGQKVLTVGPDRENGEVTCLTDHAAASDPNPAFNISPSLLTARVAT